MLPRETVNVPSQRCSSPGWTGLEQPALVEGFPSHDREARTE